MGSCFSSKPSDKFEDLLPSQEEFALLRKKLKNTLSDPAALNTILAMLSNEATIQQRFLNPEKLALYYKDNPCKIKLVIVDLETWQEHKMFAFVVANISDMMGFTKYGLVHVGIQIGSHVLHWFNDSLVHFTDIASKSALLAVDIGALNLQDPQDHAKLRQVAYLCKDYNMNKQYDNQNCNCHTFTDDVLQALDLNKDVVTLEGQLGTFLKKMRTTMMQKEFVDPLSQERIVFTSHKQLDDYVQDLKKRANCKSNAQLMSMYTWDMALLKAFDRAFWLGKFDDEKRMKRKGANCNEPSNCCMFGNPFDSSFMAK